MRRSKTQLELLSVYCRRREKRIFLKIHQQQKEDLYWMQEEIVTKDEEKAEVFNGFFASVLNTKTRWPLCTSSLS